MKNGVFEDRTDAGIRLGEALKSLPLKDPLVLAIPCGGIEVAAPVARALGAELDVVLSRKLRAPAQPELALGAVSETGDVYLTAHAEAVCAMNERYLEEERSRQMAAIEQRRRIVRAVRPQARVAGRSVIVVDDGIATGSTMIAALRTIRAGGPLETIVAVPVASSDRLAEVARDCDRIVCLLEPEDFWAVGQYYRHFDPVDEARVADVLREFARHETGPATQEQPG